MSLDSRVNTIPERLTFSKIDQVQVKMGNFFLPSLMYRTTAHISTCAYKRKAAVFVVIPVPILFVYKHSASNSRGTLRTRTTRIYDSRSTIYDSSFTTRRQS